MNRPTSFQHAAETESGRTVAQELHFRAETECVRVGKKPTDYGAMLDATQRVLREDKRLARAYFDDPNTDMNEVPRE